MQIWVRSAGLLTRCQLFKVVLRDNGFLLIRLTAKFNVVDFVDEVSENIVYALTSKAAHLLSFDHSKLFLVRLSNFTLFGAFPQITFVSDYNLFGQNDAGSILHGLFNRFDGLKQTDHREVRQSV